MTAKAAVRIRRAGLPEDEPGIAAIDTGFTTQSLFEIETRPRSIRLKKKRIPPRVKRFEIYDLGKDWREWDEAHVATEKDRIVGFVASSYQFWNRRVVIWHLYVDPPHRRKGIGENLLAKVFERAERKKALAVFLETSNLNVPGIAWYETRGFSLGGVDTTLYSGAKDAGEFGVFLVRRLSRA
jgi:ribosomal protein S18 acetylase RimI-like enzyme